MFFIFNFPFKEAEMPAACLFPPLYPLPTPTPPFAKFWVPFNNGSLYSAVCSLPKSVGLQDIETADAS